MNLRAHPRYREFKAWFLAHAHEATRVADVFYRIAGPRYTTPADITSGIGAQKAGGRWNPPGLMKVVYLSRTPETALFEANEHARYYGLPLCESMPKVAVSVRVDVDKILDLANPTFHTTLPEPVANVMAEDWREVMQRKKEPIAQAIGRAVYKAGLNGVIVPSKPHPSGINLVLFPAGFTADCSLEVLNPAALEKLGKPT